MKKYVDLNMLEESLETCVYRIEWSHNWNPTPTKSNWSITVYKNGDICEEELYCYMTYENQLDTNDKKESSNIGSFVGIKTWTSSSCYKYQAYIYKDSTKSKLLCYANLSPAVFDKINIIDFLYPVGSVYMTSTNKNPNSILGAGTWTLTGKGFKNAQGSSSSSFFIPTEGNVDTHTIYYRRSGNNLWIKVLVKTLVAIGDTSVELGTLNLSALGIAGTPVSTTWHHHPYGTENGIVLCHMTTAGKISTADVVIKGSTTSVAAGASLYGIYNLTLRASDMDDSKCDKFYWQRTE